MSTIEIKADLDSAEHLFEYRGSDLGGPLDRLYSHLMRVAADLSRDAGTATTTPMPSLGGLLKPSVENEHRQRLRITLSDAFAAMLGAQECRRTPDRTWKLNMSKLRWLYRELSPQ